MSGSASKTAQNPGDLVRLFQERFNARDMEGLLDLYEPGAILIPQPGASALAGPDDIRGGLGALLETGAFLELGESRVLQAGDLALLIHDGHLTAGRSPDGGTIDLTTRSSDVARRQADGTWRLVIDNPWGTI